VREGVGGGVCLFGGFHGVMKLFSLFCLFYCLFGDASLFRLFGSYAYVCASNMTLICCWDEEDGRCKSFVAHTLLFNRVMNQFEAARVGDLQQLRVALSVDNLNDGDEYGCTALHYAAEYGHDECVKYCIEMGADVNARCNDGFAITRCINAWACQYCSRIIGCGCNC
jgi:hypothetical protein